MLKHRKYKILFLILINFVTGFENSNSQIVTEWVDRFDNGFYDSGSIVKIDKNNNVYVLGATVASNNKFDIVLMKYTLSGILQWTKFFDGPDKQDDNPSYMSLDSTGNICIAGSSIGLTSGRDGIILKYNPEGLLMWSKRFTSSGNHSDAISGITCNSGNVFVTGFSYGGPTVDCITLKYDSNGNELWSSRYTVGTGSTQGYNIIDDPIGNSYVNGRCNGDAMTLKYDTQGNMQWSRFYNGPGNSEDVTYWIMIDSAFNIYSAGSSIGGSNSFRDFLILKYSNSGDSLLTIRYNGSGQFDDDIRAMVFDNSGNILVTGQSMESGQGYNFTTIKYSPEGKQLWKSFYNNGPNDFGRSIAVDSENNVYITGYSDGNGTNYDFATVKYDSAGNQKWIMRYDFSGKYDDQAYSIALDNMANVYITGISNRDILTIKYSVPTVVNNFAEFSTKENYLLFQNYPNPFNPITNIPYSIKTSGNVKIKVYDIIGNEIKIILNEYKTSGRYDFDFDGTHLNSGVYFYSLYMNEEIMDTKKMLLIK